MPQADRRQAYRRGLLAETSAAWLLRLKGYRILARRVRTPMGEIDLVARRGRTLAFVEVKARPTDGEAMEAVTARQARRLVGAARYWMTAQRRHADGDCRFDIVLVNPYLLPRHLPNAFGADLW
jgi:putative endonuclease